MYMHKCMCICVRVSCVSLCAYVCTCVRASWFVRVWVFCAGGEDEPFCGGEHACPWRPNYPGTALALCTYVYTYICIYSHRHTHMHICLYMYVYIFICTYDCIYEQYHIHVFICICIYIYIHIWIHAHKQTYKKRIYIYIYTYKGGGGWGWEWMRQRMKRKNRIRQCFNRCQDSHCICVVMIWFIKQTTPTAWTCLYIPVFFWFTDRRVFVRVQMHVHVHMHVPASLWVFVYVGLNLFDCFCMNGCFFACVSMNLASVKVFHSNVQACIDGS